MILNKLPAELASSFVGSDEILQTAEGATDFILAQTVLGKLFKIILLKEGG